MSCFRIFLDCGALHLDYASYHGVHDQNLAAFAAALLCQHATASRRRFAGLFHNSPAGHDRSLSPNRTPRPREVTAVSWIGCSQEMQYSWNDLALEQQLYRTGPSMKQARLRVCVKCGDNTAFGRSAIDSFIAGEHHTKPPLVPFAPFGSIAIKDCVLEAQMHTLCPGHHGLRYAGWAWNCRNNTRVAQDPSGGSFTPSSKADDVSASDIVVHYDKLDRDRDCSESITRNMFKWLREADGLPVAERDIRNQEWVDEGWSSEGESVAPEGDGRSTTDRRHVGPWICRGITMRCNMI
ncbi:hypothetical protein TOPH_07703 [Tolypocladium ophioglossoides CBS 100239]|uniref:Uncharacterized protein n=1 Tax=Tolypocladium ophioglossoides (strain CBS 100239) TaxID=1163406 RepID=A0A0L0N102_TOLOC|nr:hypothetical protein TOPH_07703 [Tolypocladium ophioglossoides CBS 100239]